MVRMAYTQKFQHFETTMFYNNPLGNTFLEAGDFVLNYLYPSQSLACNIE